MLQVEDLKTELGQLAQGLARHKDRLSRDCLTSHVRDRAVAEADVLATRLGRLLRRLELLGLAPAELAAEGAR